jgi:hypothetical protein
MSYQNEQRHCYAEVTICLSLEIAVSFSAYFSNLYKDLTFHCSPSGTNSLCLSRKMIKIDLLLDFCLWNLLGLGEDCVYHSMLWNFVLETYWNVWYRWESVHWSDRCKQGLQIVPVCSFWSYMEQTAHRSSAGLPHTFRKNEHYLASKLTQITLSLPHWRRIGASLESPPVVWLHICQCCSLCSCLTCIIAMAVLMF